MPHPQRISPLHAIPFGWPISVCLLTLLFCAPYLLAQEVATPQTLRARTAIEEPAAAVRRAHAFAATHQAPLEDSPAAALATARTQHTALVQAQATSLNTAWQPVGPLQVQSLSYGLVTGRVTALALDPNDSGNNTLCTITPQYRDLSATGTVTVTVLTGTTAAAIPVRALLLLLPLPLWMLRRKGMQTALLTLAAIVLLVSAQGCGSNKVIPIDGSGGSGGGGSAPTPTGTYTITVSATAAGVTHSVPLTLKVQ